MQEVQQFLGVLLALALLGGTLWWLRNKGMAQLSIKRAGGKGRSIQVMERLALTPQHSLHLVRVEGRTLLIAASPGGCSILDGVPVPPTEGTAVQ